MAGLEGVGVDVGEGVAVGAGSGAGVADGSGVGAAMDACVGCGVTLACGVLVGAGLSGGVAPDVGTCVHIVDAATSGVAKVEATSISLPLIAQAKVDTIMNARTAETIRSIMASRKMHQSCAVASAFPRLRLERAR